MKMKKSKAILVVLAAVFFLSLAVFAYASLGPDTSLFGNEETTVTPVASDTVPNNVADPGNMNNTFHDNSSGSSTFGSGF
jgi:hypothetical protein